MESGQVEALLRLVVLVVALVQSVESDQLASGDPVELALRLVTITIVNVIGRHIRDDQGQGDCTTGWVGGCATVAGSWTGDVAHGFHLSG